MVELNIFQNTTLHRHFTHYIDKENAGRLEDTIATKALFQEMRTQVILNR